MKSRLLLIGAALAAATAIPAQAGVEADAFTAFKSTCGAGSYANAVAAAVTPAAPTDDEPFAGLRR